MTVADNYFLRYHELVLRRIRSGQTQLYRHQQQALLAIYQKAARGEMNADTRAAALILAGVGTGKTLTQALTPYILAPWMSGKQALFLSDNCTLRTRFLNDFPTDSHHKPIYNQWPLYRLQILPPGVPPPKLVELDAAHFNSYAYAMQQADLLVGNRQFLVNLVQRGDIEPESIGVIVCDEAHFSAASSYRTIFNYFDIALISYFTGSKFRSDSQPLPYVRYTEVDELDDLGRSRLTYAPVADYEFTVQQAWQLNPPPIKKLCLQEASSAAFLVLENDREVEYNPEEFFLKAQTDKQWFRQILFADSFSLPVLSMSVRILLDKRSHTGQPHAMLVRALNIPHVHRVAMLLEENFPVLKGKIGVIHSEHDEYDLAGRASIILERFYSGEYWVIVHCGLVGVGFDHKWVSVSCCLCILRSMSPAEQEWGRALRSVPGLPPGEFPELNHSNWGVVVTHSALGLRELFEKFQQGVTSDVVKNTTPPKQAKVLTAEYEAGDSVLKLSDTTNVKPGDVLELHVPVAVSEAVSPKFSLVKELLSSGIPSHPGFDTSTPSNAANDEASVLNSSQHIQHEEQRALLPWQQEVDAIGERLAQIKSIRTYQVQVEAILDTQFLQITPTPCDFPKGVEVRKSRTPVETRDANFLQHVGLDWQVLVGEEQISYREYLRQVVLYSKGMVLDQDGEIIAGGVRLKDTMPTAAYELLLKGLETELANEVDEPHLDAIARPDLVKMNTQACYGAQVRSMIHDLLKQRSLIPDGSNGCSLVERPVELLATAIERVSKRQEPSFKNNSQLVHSAVFGFIKEKTGMSWSEHKSEEQYQEACREARVFLLRLREQLQWRAWR